MLNTQKAINAEKYNEWARKFCKRQRSTVLTLIYW